MRDWWQLIGSVLLLLGLGGCAVEQGKVYTRDGRTYGVTSGFTWRGQWWDYYERGSSYASGGFWNDAIPDFQGAIKQRDKDQRQARTYGLHFTDYFPHRELGIAYYNLGRYQEAIHELETSRHGEDTAKAKFYLNKARRVLLQQSKSDTARPRIILTSPQDGLLTNQLSVAVSGQAEDDSAIAALSINSQARFIELAEPRLAFTQDVALRDGANTIDVVAQDLVGGETRQRVTVYVDRHGPLVSISKAQVVGAAPQRRVRLEGFVTDQSRLTRLLVAEKMLALPTGKSGEFRDDILLTGHATSLAFEAEDAAGNVTRGDITLDTDGLSLSRQGKTFRPAWTRWAALLSPTIVDIGMGYGVPRLLAQAHDAPVIKLRNVEEKDVVYEGTLYLEGQVRSSSNIQTFAINGEARLPRMAPQIFFGEQIALKEGENNITLEAADAQGQKTQHPLVVTRETPPTRQLSSRLRVILMPFEKKGTETTLAAAVDDQLFNTFVNQGRFDFVERQQLESLLKELKLSQTALVDPKTAPEIGKFVAADGMMIGTVVETPKTADKPSSLEMYVRFVDMETTVVLAATDVYGEDLSSLQGLQKLMDGLSWKLQRHFPIVEGVIVGLEGKKILTDLTAEQGMKQYMKLLVFRPGGEIKHPTTGRILKKPPKIVGEARLATVSQETSEATMLPGKAEGDIQESDMVITK